MIVIPAIDIIDGQVVRLEEGKYETSKSYSTSVLEQAKKYDEKGFEWVHIVDLVGSKSGEISVLEILKDIKESTKLKIEFGGGIRSLEDAELLLNSGVDRIIIGSLSIKDRLTFEKMVRTFGCDKFVVAADVQNEMIRIKGWTEETDIALDDHIRYCMSLCIRTFLVTDIAKDGKLGGPNFDLYKKLQSLFPSINLIVSGGVSNIDDVKIAENANYYATIVGKAIYENKLSLEELAEIG